MEGGRGTGKGRSKRRIQPRPSAEDQPDSTGGTVQQRNAGRYQTVQDNAVIGQLQGSSAPIMPTQAVRARNWVAAGGLSILPRLHRPRAARMFRSTYGHIQRNLPEVLPGRPRRCVGTRRANGHVDAYIAGSGTPSGTPKDVGPDPGHWSGIGSSPAPTASVVRRRPKPWNNGSER